MQLPFSIGEFKEKLFKKSQVTMEGDKDLQSATPS